MGAGGREGGRERERGDNLGKSRLRACLVVLATGKINKAKEGRWGRREEGGAGKTLYGGGGGGGEEEERGAVRMTAGCSL